MNDIKLDKINDSKNPFVNSIYSKTDDLEKQLKENKATIKDLQDRLNKAYLMLGYVEADNPGYIKACHDKMVEKLFEIKL